MKPLILIIALVLGGCVDTRNKLNKAAAEYRMYNDTIQDHVYITTKATYAVSTIHAAHCSCKVVK